MGYQGSQWNLYEYVGGRPGNFVDPHGMSPIGAFGVGLAVSAYIGCLAAHYFAIMNTVGDDDDKFNHCMWVCSSGVNCGLGPGVPILLETIYEGIEVFCFYNPGLCPPNAQRHNAAEAIKDIISDHAGGFGYYLTIPMPYATKNLSCACFCKLQSWLRS